YEDIKKIFEKAIVAPHFVHLLLTGAPGSAKTLFLLECFQKLNNSYFTDNNSTGAGIVDYLFEHPNTKYLLIDEFEKLSKNDQNVLLNVMETGILTSTKIKRTKSMKLNLKIFATSNNIELISKPIRSRFLRLHLKEYDEKTFHQIVIGLLTKEYKKSGGLAATISTKVWNKMKSNDIRDAIKVAKLSTSIEDVDSIVNTILRYRSQTNKLELLTN
ncbi:MAG: AAA family ATPase, partial [Nitrososphaeraceae archaeon]